MKFSFFRCTFHIGNTKLELKGIQASFPGLVLTLIKEMMPLCKTEPSLLHLTGVMTNCCFVEVIIIVSVMRLISLSTGSVPTYTTGSYVLAQCDANHRYYVMSCDL